MNNYPKNTCTLNRILKNNVDTATQKRLAIVFIPFSSSITFQMQDHLSHVQLQLTRHLLVSARGGPGRLPHQAPVPPLSQLYKNK